MELKGDNTLSIGGLHPNTLHVPTVMEYGNKTMHVISSVQIGRQDYLQHGEVLMGNWMLRQVITYTEVFGYVTQCPART